MPRGFFVLPIGSQVFALFIADVAHDLKELVKPIGVDELFDVQGVFGDEFGHSRTFRLLDVFKHVNRPIAVLVYPYINRRRQPTTRVGL